MIKAVILDMDGTIVDSEVLHFDAYSRVMDAFGKKITKDDYWRLWGTDTDMCERFVLEFRLAITSEELLELKNKTFREDSLPKIKTRHGLLELLKNLKKDGYLLAVASSSQAHEIKVVLENLKITRFFNQVASAESVKYGKPAPDIYLLAAKSLNVQPEDCLVLEDAPQGVLAAKSAGMKCFAIPSQEIKDQDFSKADKVLDNLEEVYHLLKNSLRELNKF